MSEAAEWRDIETAPRDGTWVLLTGGQIDYHWDRPDEPRAVVGQCCDAGDKEKGTPPEWQFAWYDGGHYGVYDGPTHWMPVPSLPEAKP